MRQVSRLAALILAAAAAAPAQQISNLDRAKAREMLKDIAMEVRKHYYDPKLHGFDFDARVSQADEHIQTAKSVGEAMAYVAWALDGLNDSHTFFLPPRRTIREDYGWRMQMIGERCYVVGVKPKTDAASKGLKPGDEILSVNGTAPTRDLFEKMQYLYNVLRPQPALRLESRGVDGQLRQLDVQAKTYQLKKVVDLAGGTDIWDYYRQIENADRLLRVRHVEVNDALMIAKLPIFFLDRTEVEHLIALARKHQGLILDLRDNPGGSVDTLSQLLGGFFDAEVKIGDRVGREQHKPFTAKPLGHAIFTGKLIVLVDSLSSSAAELFPRVIQLEKRGTVLGDRTSGLVMEARQYGYMVGGDTVMAFGASITDADLIMSDGKSLESNGVQPDELILPTGADLARGRDPVLARAAELLGVKMTPEQAGKLFPFEWPVE